jgi:predicted membrane-bound spermidine synthase
MSTTVHPIQTTQENMWQRGGKLQKWLLIILVFVAGATSLAVELSASRLLAPYFGTSLFVWANLIGLILLYLTVGYYVGGRLADRYPYPMVLYALTSVAALCIGVIPLIARPILSWSLTAFASLSVGEFYSSLVSAILLCAAPMILLGCVSPFAIRLLVGQVRESGRISGRLYAISTAGSIVGTFLPVLILIPNIGTRYTFMVFAVALLFVSVVGLIMSSIQTNNLHTINRSKKLFSDIKHMTPILLFIPLLLMLTGLQGPIKAVSGIGDGSVLVAERESLYNYIQVVRLGDSTLLALNEGLAIHSIYNPHSILTDGPWDYFSIAPYFNNPPFTPKLVRRVCIIGLGAGTIPRELTAAYGPIPIDGVEIDPAIVDLGRAYFAMNEPNLHVIIQDGRYYMDTTSQRYDMIGLDAYQQPYVPFQLTTVEFFRTLQAHLAPTGVVMMNVGQVGTDTRLVTAMAQNLRSVFPSVYIISSPRSSYSLVVATAAPTKLANFWINTRRLGNPVLRTVAWEVRTAGNVHAEKTAKVVFTDDRAPVEQLIDSIIFNVVQQIEAPRALDK